MLASIKKLCATCATHALCVAAGAALLTACAKSTIDPVRYGQSNGQSYAQSAAPVQTGTLQESTLSEAPLPATAGAPGAAGATGAPGAAPIVGEGPSDGSTLPYTAPGQGQSAPAQGYTPPAQGYTPPAAPAPAAPASHDGPIAPSAEEELQALRSASQAPYAPAASAPAPASAAAPAGQQRSAVAPTSGGTVYQLQSFMDRSRAQSYRDQLAAKGHDVFFEDAVVNGQSYTRVLIRLQGTEPERRGVLSSLGVPDARPRRDAPGAASGAAPAATPAAAPSAPLAKPAPVQSVPAAKPAPGALPVVTPPAQPAPAAAPSPAGGAASGAGGCQVTASHIQATGVGLPGAGSPLMIEKQAREDATRNLLLCVDAYRKERGQVPESYSMQASIPPGLLQVGDVELQADGSVRATMRIRLADLPQLDVQVLD